MALVQGPAHEVTADELLDHMEILLVHDPVPANNPVKIQAERQPNGNWVVRATYNR
jgi:hypothetical protein